MKLGVGLVIFVFCIKQSFSQTSFSSDAKLCSNCHRRAICTQMDSYVTCKCKPGYVGNGITCTALALSNDASCPQGYKWSTQSKMCVDIDECLTNIDICASACYDKNGIYLCAYNASVLCPNISCEAGKDCVKKDGVLQCVDPCTYSLPLNANDRLYTINSTGVFQTDQYNYGWFKYTDGFRMRELNAGYLKCGSVAPFSLGVAHTNITQSITTVPLRINSKIPTTGPSIQAKDCGGFYAYKFTGSIQPAVYCTEPVPPATTTPTTTTTTTPTTTTTTTPTTPTSISTTDTSPTKNNDTSTITPAASSTLLTPTIPTSTDTILPISPTTIMSSPTSQASSSAETNATVTETTATSTPFPTHDPPFITSPTTFSTLHSTLTTTPTIPISSPTSQTILTSSPTAPTSISTSTDTQTTSVGTDTTSVTDTTVIDTSTSHQTSTPITDTQTTSVGTVTTPVTDTTVTETSTSHQTSSPTTDTQTTSVGTDTTPVTDTDTTLTETTTPHQTSTPITDTQTTSVLTDTTSVTDTTVTEITTSHQTSTPITDTQTTSMVTDTTSVTNTTFTETTNSPTASTPTSFTQTHTVTTPNAPQSIKLTISIFGSSGLINFLYIPLYNSSSNTPLHVVLEAQDSSNSRKHVILVNSWFAFGNDTSEDQTFFDNYKTKNCLLENNECYQEIPDANPSPVRAFTNSNNGASESSCLSKCQDGKQWICN